MIGACILFAIRNRYVTYSRNDDTSVGFLVLAAAVFLLGLYYRHCRRSRWASSAFGSAEWVGDKLLRAWGMIGPKSFGLVLGRTGGGELIRMPRYCHVLLCGGTGAGKGVSIIIPNLLDYRYGSLVVFDTKGDLFARAERRKAWGERIIRLAPFNGGQDQFNPLDSIPADSPLLIDSARALAESLVVPQGTEPDPHWNDKSVQVLTALLVFVLRRLTGEERSLNSVQDIASDPLMVAAVADKLKAMGGIAGRLGDQLGTLFDKGDKPGVLSKEGAGVFSTVARHLSFLDSEMVAMSVANSTFEVPSLLEPGTTLFLQIPGDQLEAQKGLLRCWVSTLIRVIGSSGSEEKSEVLFLLDEASALGSLASIEEALVRGRSAGVRLLLAYQSAAQIESAFEGKPTLLYDNCSNQIWLCPPGSYETAERISKSCGDSTQWVMGHGTNTGGSSTSSQQGGGSSTASWGSSTNYSQSGRALLKPEEVLTLNENCLIAFLRGLPGPVLAERVKWYDDPDFNPSAGKRRRSLCRPVLWEVCKAVCFSVFITFCVVMLAYWVDRGQRW